ncbi:MAG: site-2 protease family protein [Rubripirellula sp.]
MIFQEPAHSPYDLRFTLMGFPVRISWTFWLAGAVFGFSLVRGLDDGFDAASPGLLPLLVLWTLCLFVSILIHELGHALAFRQNGLNASIVLYHFGGLAIPTNSLQGGRGYGGISPKQNMWISFAGPLAQVVSALVVVAVVKAAGYQLWVFTWMPGPLAKVPGMLDGAVIDSPGVFSMVSFYIYPSIVWALLNLVPVYPLDGGQIMRSIVQIQGGNIVQSLWISVIASALMAAYGFSNGQQYMGFLFLVLGVTNFQAIQQAGGGHF